MSVEAMKKALTALNVAASYAEHQQMAEFFEEEAKDLRQSLAQQAFADSVRPIGKSITKVWVDEFFYGQDPNVLPASNKGENHDK